MKLIFRGTQKSKCRAAAMEGFRLALMIHHNCEVRFLKTSVSGGHKVFKTNEGAEARSVEIEAKVLLASELDPIEVLGQFRLEQRSRFLFENVWTATHANIAIQASGEDDYRTFLEARFEGDPIFPRAQVYQKFPRPLASYAGSSLSDRCPQPV